MDTQQPRRRIPSIQFRVLIIGRANAGKTSILQRVCETTESPIIYRGEPWRNDRVTLDPSMDRGEHTIEDELMFSNHMGFVFHDSRGIESCSIEELEILQEFIRRKCGESGLRNKLHVIWYCIPMDNQRPGLDLKFFNDICPDKNVPVIAVFTKYDQFRRNVQIDLDDYEHQGDNVTEATEKLFQEHYLHPLGDLVGFVRLEQMHKQNRSCDDLIEKTAAALNEDTVALMLLAVQKGNLELSVKTALNRVYSLKKVKCKEDMVRECLIPFPYIWWIQSKLEEDFQQELTQQSSTSRSELSLRSFQYRRNPFILQVISLPTVQKLTGTGLGDHHLILAIILILKHATFLRVSNLSPKSALMQAELDYREANIDLNVQQYLTASSEEHSVELFTAFIMNTDIVPSRSSVENRAHRTDH